MNIPKVSVIVLIYKVEKYIERCARSLFCQTMQDIEYVFVNDCTPGRCVVIHDAPSFFSLTIKIDSFF